MKKAFAALAATGLLVTMAPPAQAASKTWCKGDAVRRCLYIHLVEDGTPGSNSSVLSYSARTTDVKGGANYRVAVENLRLQQYSARGWRTLITVADRDGWDDSYDPAAFMDDLCRRTGKYSYRIRATFKWYRVGSNTVGKETWNSPSFRRTSSC